MICLTFRHWSWNLIFETHQYQRIRHFSLWMPFGCALSFGVEGQVQKGTQGECRYWRLKWECWTLPLSCWLILDVSEAHLSSFRPLMEEPNSDLGCEFSPWFGPNTISDAFCSTINRSCLWFICAYQSHLMIRTWTQFPPLSKGMQCRLLVKSVF